MASMRSTVSFTILLVVGLLVDIELHATSVDKCHDDIVQGKTLDVAIAACSTSQCNLMKNTDPIVTIRFKPNSKVSHLKHRISAKVFCIFGKCVWKGYDGVDGTSADDKIFLSGSKTRAKFPLEPTKEYVYNNSFHIESYYPSMFTTVYWALKTSDEKTVTCFLLDVRITSSD